jgi:hypothetical protein
MKSNWILLFILFIGVAHLRAQDDGYDAWCKKKEEAYDKWKKMRTDIISHLPNNPHQDAVSSFIDHGFDRRPAQTPQTPPAQHAGQATGSDQTSIAPVATVPNVNQPATTPNFKIWVVIVGVATYEIEENNLGYTDDDAYRMYAFYKSPEGGSLPDNQITLLIDEEATRTNVVNAIITTYAHAGKDDVIIFYFSGHGAEGAFITHEFNGVVDANYTGLLLHEELNDIFMRSPARYKYIIADACHSGTLTETSSAHKTGARTRGVTFYQAFEKSPGGFVLMLSSMGDELSIESSGIRQGIFSHYIIRGLKGESDTNRDHVVSVIELFDFVENNVKEVTQGRQHPVLSGDYDDALPIAIVLNPD